MYISSVISVGLTSINDKKKILEVREMIREQVSQAKNFHLRGRLSRAKLSLLEKILLKNAQ
ncbi:hypothetical protein ID741_003552 [Enterococcus sp. AZ103]